MTPDDAKRIVLRHVEHNKVNITWLAEQIEAPKQTVHQWLKGGYEPRDPSNWTRIATALGLTLGTSLPMDVCEHARDFALDVLVATDDPEFKAKAARLIKEISKNFRKPLDTRP